MAKILILGGNRFFGKHLADQLAHNGNEVTLFNRGTIKTTLKTIVVNRNDSTQLKKIASAESWDIVYDQICYTATDAKMANEAFSGKTKRYIFTSSVSVYAMNENLREENFEPRSYSFQKETKKEEDYAESKRQAEHIFATGPLSTCMIRFPIVVGPGDYTGRFQWHFNRIKNNLPMYFPSLDYRMSLIHEIDAAKALYQLGFSKFIGPINCAAHTPLLLKDFISAIEMQTGQKAIFTQEAGSDNSSPYGINNNWWINTEKMRSEDISVRDLPDWLPNLIKS